MMAFSKRSIESGGRHSPKSVWASAGSFGRLFSDLLLVNISDGWH